eukprot:153756_1
MSKWTCKICTFAGNDEKMKRCDVCVVPRYEDDANSDEKSDESNKENLQQDWESDAERTRCPHCEQNFNILRRRHHCRQCGLVVCESCSSDKKYLPKYDAKVRVCAKCFLLDSTESDVKTPAPVTKSIPSSEQKTPEKKYPKAASYQAQPQYQPARQPALVNQPGSNRYPDFSGARSPSYYASAPEPQLHANPVMYQPAPVQQPAVMPRPAAVQARQPPPPNQYMQAPQPVQTFQQPRHVPTIAVARKPLQPPMVHQPVQVRQPISANHLAPVHQRSPAHQPAPVYQPAPRHQPAPQAAHRYNYANIKPPRSSPLRKLNAGRIRKSTSPFPYAANQQPRVQNGEHSSRNSASQDNSFGSQAAAFPEIEGFSSDSNSGDEERKEETAVTYRDVNQSVGDTASKVEKPNPVFKWLTDNDFAQYIPNFKKACLTSVRMVEAVLDEKLLARMGVELGPAMMILKLWKIKLKEDEKLAAEAKERKNKILSAEEVQDKLEELILKWEKSETESQNLRGEIEQLSVTVKEQDDEILALKVSHETVERKLSSALKDRDTEITALKIDHENLEDKLSSVLKEREIEILAEEKARVIAEKARVVEEKQPIARRLMSSNGVQFHDDVAIESSESEKEVEILKPEPEPLPEPVPVKKSKSKAKKKARAKRRVVMA